MGGLCARPVANSCDQHHAEWSGNDSGGGSGEIAWLACLGPDGSLGGAGNVGSVAASVR